MSNFAGITFTKQAVSPSDDAIVRRALLSDGILTGCAFTYSGSTLTMAAGHLMICGRQIKHPASQNWAVVDATSGFARLVLTIDMTRTATKDSFDQVVDSIEYASAVDGFVNLEQSDINGSGTRYQVAACVVSLGAGGITGIVSQLERSEGGGSGLNFSVVGSDALPSGPKENMIWAITSEPVTGWIFAAEAPADPERGLLWIKTGVSSAVAFNAVKKNGIELYPISAKQHTGSSWVDVTCRTYQNGEWVNWWAGEIYELGVFYTDHSNSVTNGTVTYNADHLLFTTKASSVAEVYEMFGPFSLAEFNEISAIFTNDTTNLNSTACIFVSPNTGAKRSDAAAIIETDMAKGTSNLEVTLDVSSISNECYVYVGTNTTGEKWTAARNVHVTFVKAEV